MTYIQTIAPIHLEPDKLIDSPDAPPLGVGFPDAMEHEGFKSGQEKKFLCHALTNTISYPIQAANNAIDWVRMIPGHALAGAPGPEPAPVMIIGKMPGREEVQQQRYFVGESGKILRNLLTELNVPHSNWYATNVCRFGLPIGMKDIRKTWIKECAYFLFQEILLVKPKFLLLLGADAIKSIFPNQTLKRIRGAFIENNGMQVFSTTNPAAVIHKPEMRPAFVDDMRVFTSALKNGHAVKKPTKYWYIDNQEDLDNAVDKLIGAGANRFAMDCEWAGRHFKTGHLRTIQICWSSGQVIVIRLRDDSQEECFKPNRYAAVNALRKLLFREGVQIIGHGFRADLPWLIEFGLTDILHYFYMDTMLVNHVLEENAQHALSAVVLRTSDLGRYDLELEEWKRKHGLGDDGGYGLIPDKLLLKYAAQDADGSYRAGRVLEAELNRDENKKLKDLYFNVIHPVTEAILEIEMTGLHTDSDRMRSLACYYADKRDDIARLIKLAIQNPKFNFRSHRQIQTLLYEKHKLRPIKTTKAFDNTPWQQFVGQYPDRSSDFTVASTDAETLGILSTKNPDIPVISQLRDLKFVDQICKNFLRLPASSDDYFAADEECTEGLMGLIQFDQRTRPYISQLTTTGRWRCFNPNLQNIPKRRERDYDRIFDPIPVPKLRSCFMARPGYVLVEADYVQAELFVLAWISGDDNLLAVLSTPGRDLHSEMAREMFNLKCFIGIRDGVMVDEVKENHEGLRVGAKAVNFGIIYGRGAVAISREVLQEGIRISVAEADAGLTGFFNLYPGVKPYVDRCGLMAIGDGYIENYYGRRRRFPKTSDEGQRAAYKREACNFPIQSKVADTLSIAATNIVNYRKRNRLNGEALDYKLVLAIHDAIILEVRADHVKYVVEHVLPQCMCEQAVIPVINKKLDIDVSLALRWSEDANNKSEKGRKVIEKLVAMGVDKSLF